ncbi:helix-turn-helix domain-containing protein [Kitasatospora sp. NPDC088346]|uniref:helix-turn-helix domain-containing protein n=1 Tax=Kitasatospora sp. NPDC088346 TaxID=3364073 RepID=UPI00381B81CD
MLHRSAPDQGWEIAEARPHPLLRPGVHGYRGIRLALRRPRRRLELPTGEVTLFLGLDHRIRIHEPAATRSAADGPPAAGVRSAAVRSASYGSLLSGPRTRASTGEHDGELFGVEVVMAPWAAYRLFGLPMAELAGRAVELDAVLGDRAARTLTAGLTAAPDWPQRFAALDVALCRLGGPGPDPAPQVLGAWGELVRTAGLVSIRRLAEDSGWSWRRLDRAFQEQVGLGPKAVARVLRLRHCLRLTSQGRPPAEVAAVTGFYDQAHLCREFRAMTGLSTGQFLAGRQTANPGPPALDRLSGEVTSVVLPP